MITNPEQYILPSGLLFCIINYCINNDSHDPNIHIISGLLLFIMIYFGIELSYWLNNT